jgi:hypothetical protein
LSRPGLDGQEREPCEVGATKRFASTLDFLF